jgi:LemA protein
MGWSVIVVIGVLVLIVLAFVGIYNSLVRWRTRVQDAWAQIDVQLKRRHDLIPNLVNTVKGYMQHERTVLENVTKARQQAIDVTGIADKAQAENILTGALRQLFAVAENYPDLKANQNFLALQEELTSTENKVAYARQFYNDTVMTYNVKTQQVPSAIVASMFGFRAAEFFQIEDAAERQAPVVQF